MVFFKGIYKIAGAFARVFVKCQEFLQGGYCENPKLSQGVHKSVCETQEFKQCILQNLGVYTRVSLILAWN